MSSISLEYLGHLGCDLTVANTARVSFGKWKQEFDEKDAKLIDYLARHEHTSPFRHTAVQLRCKAPIFIARQLGKHQAGLSWNEVSRRYVDDNFEFFVPDSWRSRPDGSVKQGSGVDLDQFYQDTFSHYYEKHVEDSIVLYECLIKNGVAPEQARMVLPQSMMTEWIWTGNLFSFFHVYRLRIDTHAQKEAQEFAEKLGVVMQDLFPHCWSALNDSK